jgi:predicted transcriptional regulator
MANELHLAAAEERLAEIIWAHAPVRSIEIARMTKQAFAWEKSTTYTLLKRLTDKGVIKTENAVVSALISKEDFYARQSHDFVAGRFGGSLPAFITSFIGAARLSDAQADELIRLIEAYKEGQT